MGKVVMVAEQNIPWFVAGASGDTWEMGGVRPAGPGTVIVAEDDDEDEEFLEDEEFGDDEDFADEDEDFLDDEEEEVEEGESFDEDDEDL